MASVRNVLKSVDFEVFGRVQGVFFRKYTRKTAQQHGLVGWVMNTSAGTVKGQVQGPEEKLILMKDWLKNKGSPSSWIKECLFSNERNITNLEYENFFVKGGW
ncbi:acylphosphatase-2-like isoform X1 [Tubulanus polymorphus]|uniref:acylphosphatase-2-like isoform X1 n=1 Tax=Tubulanus polymorphus TaxID=672921 RepID=UPI003DA23EB7